MESEFMKTARRTVLFYIQKHQPKTPIEYDDTYVVWFCKTLQNWKALISTTIPDGMYYEVTYNGDKKEIYLDAYKKCENVVVFPDKPGSSQAHEQVLMEA